MTSHESAIEDGVALGARTEAAALLAAAVADESASITTRLHCIAARVALQVATVPSLVAAEPTSAEQRSADALITRALAVLGNLPIDQFADSRVRSAARHARRALRGDS